MASDDLELDGVTLTLEECEEVLAFWDAHCVGEVPECLAYSDAEEFAWTLGPPWERDDAPVLTSDVIERIRDYATPWTEVPRREVKSGMRVRVVTATGVFIGEGLVTDYYASDQLVVRSDGSVCDGSVFALYTTGRQVCFIRRPRKRTLTLEDVEPGQRFIFAHLPDQPRRRTRQGFVNEGTWDHEVIPAGSEVTTVPVTPIEEDDRMEGSDE